MNPQKTVVFDTNFNGKLSTDHFIHIAQAPAQMIPESVLNGTIIEIQTKDGTHPPILAKVDDLARFPFSKMGSLPSALSWCSHGMDIFDLVKQIQLNQAPEDNTEFAIYFYKKVKPTA